MSQVMNQWKISGDWSHDVLLFSLWLMMLLILFGSLRKGMNNATVYMKNDFRIIRANLSFFRIVIFHLMLLAIEIMLGTILLVNPFYTGIGLLLLFIFMVIVLQDRIAKRILYIRDPEAKVYQGELISYQKSLGGGGRSENIYLCIRIIFRRWST